MDAPPLAELYDLLRAEGFAIGVDDHVRIGRLLAHEAAWTPELLRTAIAALVVKGPDGRGAFDACWERWMAVALPRRPTVPAAIEPPAARAEPPGTAPEGSHLEPPPPAGREQPRPRGEAPHTARRVRILRLLALGAAVAVISAAVAVALVVRSCAGGSILGSGSGQQLAEPTGGSGQQVTESGSGSNPPLAGSGSGQQVMESGSGSNPPLAPRRHRGAAQPGSGSGQQLVGSRIDSDAQPTGPKNGAVGSGNQTLPSRATFDIATFAVALGTMVLAIVAIAGVLGARRRRRFVPGPWRYVLAVPRAARPVLPRNAIEDAAADLTWRAPGAGRELDVARSVAATVERGGLPTLVHRRQSAAPRYLVLEDTAGGAGRWQPIYDELLAGLAREGVTIERYRFAGNPEDCVRPDGHDVPLGELVDHADALIVIGDGAAAVDPLDGRRAGWLASLRHIPRRLWINPLPPVRWSAGARAIAEDTPMEHGVTRAVAALHAGVDRHARPARPYPAAIERAPQTASAIAALRAALGEPAFHLVSAVAVAAPPTLAAARWLAEVLALELDEQDWLAVATLPWLGAEAWPDGLRDGLRSALDAEAPDLARAAAAISDGLLAVSEPPRGSAAHLAWQLEGAERAARRGERAAVERSLRRIAWTPLADQARRLRAAFGLPDRARRARAWAMAIGVALVVGPVAYRVVATRLRPPAEAAASSEAGALAATATDAGAAAPSVSDATDAGAHCPADMVAVPAGTFRMGSPGGDRAADNDEHPAHEVMLPAYCIDRTEVTVKSYAACVQAEVCTAAEEPARTGFDSFCNGTRTDRQDHPINCVGWNQAALYCAWAGKRLPTEAEWEYAARGNDGRTYPWGNEAPSAERLNACGHECAAMAKRELTQDWTLMYDASDGWEATAPVGRFPAGASPFGALDMAGNVWEWTADWYGPYPAAAVTNPHGPESGGGRVLRGGAWIIHDAALFRAAYRVGNEPSVRYNDVGLRCARGD